MRGLRRDDALAAWRDSGCRAEDVAAEFGVSRGTLYNEFGPRTAAGMAQRAAVPPVLEKGRWVSMEALKEAVVKPGIEKHLEPLMLYRGNQSMGRVRMLWNHVRLMHIVRAGTSNDGVRLHHADEACQLLGPPSKLGVLSLESFLSRLTDNIRVAENVPGLPEYLREELAFRKFNLSRITIGNEYSNCPIRRAHALALRAERLAARPPKIYEPPSGKLFYPFMIHDPQTDESALVRFVNSVVPRGLAPDTRADVCQEMLLALLTGEISRDQAHGKRYEIMKRVLRMNGVSDRSMSLDMPMPGHSKTIGELLVESEWLEPFDAVAFEDESEEDAAAAAA